jgi:hypothetical protein
MRHPEYTGKITGPSNDIIIRKAHDVHCHLAAFIQDNETDIARHIVYTASPQSSITHPTFHSISQYTPLALVCLPDCTIISSLSIFATIHISFDIPATRNGRENPRPKQSSQPSDLHSPQWVQAQHNIPMNPQYLRAKYLVNGLKGRLFLGPSG